MRATRSSVNSRISDRLSGFAPSAATIPPDSGFDSDSRVRTGDYWILIVVLSLVAVAALVFSYSRNEILLSGDAVAHISIARRVFDSRTPGLLQLGSVWLPLPHLLTIPFIVNKFMWQSGIGGSVVSLISYVLAGVGLFRLLYPLSRSAAWLATALFAANPNLLYVQSTALNEPLYLACFVWAIVFFSEAARCLLQRDLLDGRSLEKGAVALTAAIFTRYDGWFFACVCWFAFLTKALPLLRRRLQGLTDFRKAAWKPLLLTALGPAIWMAYNFGVYKNPLDFANGPYSAKAIAQQTTEQGSPPYPGQEHVLTAGTYFMKAAQLNIGESLPAKILVLVAVFASVAVAFSQDWLAIALLWSPLVFYSLSIAYGSVPIFVPVWWPFSYYNVRYGLELLPAIVAGIALSFSVVRRNWNREWLQWAVVAAVLLLTGISYFRSWRSTPVCLREVRANGSARLELDRRLASLISALPQNTVVLAYTGAHGGAFQIAGIPLRRTVNEGNLYIWDAALAQPATTVDYVISTDGDPVANAVRNYPKGLTAVASVEVPGQPRTVIYKSPHHL